MARPIEGACRVVPQHRVELPQGLRLTCRLGVFDAGRYSRYLTSQRRTGGSYVKFCVKLRVKFGFKPLCDTARETV